MNYTISNATVGLAYTNSDVFNPLSSVYVGPITPAAGAASGLRSQSFEVNGKYQFTPTLYVGAMYTYTRATLSDATGKLHPSYQPVGLMSDYNLSKRTDFYVQGVGRKVIMSHFARSKSEPPFSTVSLLRAKAGDAPEGTVDANPCAQSPRHIRARDREAPGYFSQHGGAVPVGRGRATLQGA
ncbi:porin [Burkholderia sp. LK4]|uniref:porin n=1 Tax=Burkholderia sp. LK4 TaxID=1628208 RepID=UPI003FA404FD